MKTWATDLNTITDQTLSSFGSLTPEQLNWKSNAKTWSIAQNLEHLIVVNESYYPILTALKEGSYKLSFIARFGFIVSFFGKTLLNAVQLDRRKKMKTFPMWEPSEGHEDILRRFENHQKELVQKIEEMKEFAAKGTVISSPANKNIVYKLETAFDIIVSHEKRHLEQAREVLGMLRDNSSL